MAADLVHGLCYLEAVWKYKTNDDVHISKLVSPFVSSWMDFIDRFIIWSSEGCWGRSIPEDEIPISNWGIKLWKQSTQENNYLRFCMLIVLLQIIIQLVELFIELPLTKIIYLIFINLIDRGKSIPIMDTKAQQSKAGFNLIWIVCISMYSGLIGHTLNLSHNLMKWYFCNTSFENQSSFQYPQKLISNRLIF